MSTPSLWAVPDGHASHMAETYFDEWIARHYDTLWPELFDPAFVEPSVDFLTELAGTGAALEFGIGTGRIALPLSRRGVRVHGIELSEPMITQLRALDAASNIGVTLGDFATATVDGTFSLVYLLRNTITNLTTQDEQVECFRNAARHLAAGRLLRHRELRARAAPHPAGRDDPCLYGNADARGCGRVRRRQSDRHLPSLVGDGGRAGDVLLAPPVCVVRRTRPHGATRRHGSTAEMEWIAARAVHLRQPRPCLGVGEGGVVGEQQLDGGIANAGQVVRVGPHVLRPSSPHSGSIHAFLRAVRHAGFEGASSPVGIDEDGRERLVFIDGEVPVVPYPDWSQSDTALASIARLLRGLHDAARGFDPRGLTWDDALADPAGGTLVCHNDVEPSNVVFRDGIAVALLDFEFAAPGRPVYDVAQLARLCVPIDDDFDQARLGWRPADRPARLRLVADAYGLDRDGRAELLTAMDDAIARIEAAVRRRVDAGDPNVIAMWNRTGGSERYDRRRRWWTDHHDQFAAALL